MTLSNFANDVGLTDGESLPANILSFTVPKYII